MKKIYIIFILSVLALCLCGCQKSEYEIATKEFALQYVTVTNGIADEFSLSRSYYIYKPEECLELFKDKELADKVNTLEDTAWDLIKASKTSDEQSSASIWYNAVKEIEQAILYSTQTSSLSDTEFEDLIHISDRIVSFNKSMKSILEDGWNMDASEVENLGVSQ